DRRPLGGGGVGCSLITVQSEEVPLPRWDRYDGTGNLLGTLLQPLLMGVVLALEALATLVSELLGERLETGRRGLGGSILSLLMPILEMLIPDPGRPDGFARVSKGRPFRGSGHEHGPPIPGRLDREDSLELTTIPAGNSSQESEEQRRFVHVRLRHTRSRILIGRAIPAEREVPHAIECSAHERVCSTQVTYFVPFRVGRDVDVRRKSDQSLVRVVAR